MSERKVSGYPPLVALLGATAVGKTELSLEVCRRYAGEIIGADSRQIYRGMDIGTAKPSAEEFAVAPHHLFDIRDPDETLTLSEYQALAFRTIDAIHTRNALPILVGGTVLYMRAVIDGLRIPEVPPNPELRNKLETMLAERGRDALFEMLVEKDPATAAAIDAKNPRRLIRALEIVITTGRSKVELEGADPPPYSILKIGLDRSREILHDRIDRRVDRMMDQGLVAETRRLLESGYHERLPAMSSLGYREIAAYLRGELEYDAAVEKIKVETHRYLRHQYTWLRKIPGVTWVNMDAPGGLTEALSQVRRYMDERQSERDSS